MKALVTGGTGFIGSHLVEALLQKDIHVRCLLRKTSDLRWLKTLSVEMAYGDCRDKDSLVGAVRGVDQVFHLAGTTKAQNEADYFTANVHGTENLVQACLEHNPNLQKFIFLSSQAAGGPGRNERQKKETDSNESISPYGRSKKLAEDIVLGRTNRLNAVVLRPCAVYGPRDKDVLFLFKLVSKKIKFRLAGLEQRVSLCYIQDLIDALLLAARTKEGHGEIFFISDGREHRLDEIGNAFARALNVRAFGVPVPGSFIMALAWVSEGLAKMTGKTGPLTRNKARELVQKNWICDITKARQVLNYEPQVDLDRGARLTVDWYRKEKWL